MAPSRKTSARDVSEHVTLDREGQPQPLIRLSPPGDFVVLPSSRQTLLCGVGEVEGQDVLTPYVQLQLLKSEDVQPAAEDTLQLSPVFEASLSFENLAFIVMDLSRDFRATTERLAQFSSGALPYEPWRLRYAAEVVETARDELEQALVTLQALSQAATVDEARPAAARPRSKAKSARKAAGPARS